MAMRRLSNRIHNGYPRHFFSSTSSTASLQTRKSSRISQLRSFVHYSSIRAWFVENLRNYCNTTSLHGLNYIAHKDNTRAESIFWTFIVIISIIVCIVLVFVSWFWNLETPTVTVIESSHFPTWNIPFPAVTLCNFNKISKTKAMQLVKKFQRPANMSETDLIVLFRMSMYYTYRGNYTAERLLAFDNVLKTNNYTLTRLADELSPECMDMITRCVWKGTNTRCDSLFQHVVTLDGNCCTFNYYATVDNNFPEKIAYQVPKRPYRVTGCGYPTGLSVTLNPFNNEYFGTYFSSFGFQLFIHDAYNFPDENSESRVVTGSRETFVRISPETTYATPEVRYMDVSMRNCLFANERKLAPILQRYSLINCLVQCRLRLLVKKCGCVPLLLPNNGSYKTCDVNEIPCVLENKEVFTRAMPQIEENLLIKQRTYNFPCDCKPDCEVNHYPVEVTMGRLNVKMAYSPANTINAVNPEDNILLHVFFADLMSTRYRMEVFQSWLSSLASFGGLLGLVMGFSIVTVFELVYFLTFRPMFHYLHN